MENKKWLENWRVIDLLEKVLVRTYELKTNAYAAIFVRCCYKL